MEMCVLREGWQSDSLQDIEHDNLVDYIELPVEDIVSVTIGENGDRSYGESCRTH
ncbi:MAG: hypothetical protein R3A13_06970 [Bdellovibrionota bacterium]